MDILVDLVVENRLFRESLCSCLQDNSHIREIRVSESAEKSLADLRSKPVDIVVVDSGVTELLPLLYQLKRDFTDVKIILLLSSFKNSLIAECAKIGVEGFVTNDESSEDLKSCIASVFKGELYYPSRITRLLLNQFHSPNKNSPNIKKRNLNLTYRQQSVVELVDQGLSNKQIARNLGIELATVKNHVHQIIEKLGANSRYEAAAIFRTMSTFDADTRQNKPMLKFAEKDVNGAHVQHANYSMSN